MEGHIPREFIRELVERANVADIVGGWVKLQKRGRNFFGLCPFHAEKTPSFSVNTERGFYHCFGCGASGTALDFIMHQNGGDFVEAVKTLADKMGAPIPWTRSAAAAKESGADAVLGAALNHWRKLLGESTAAVAYLKKRGINDDTARKFKLGYAADSWDNLKNALSKLEEKKLRAAGLLREKDGRFYDYFRNRLMFPIFAGDSLLGFGGRAVDGDSSEKQKEYEEAKYLNSPESSVFSKRRTVFGLPQAAAAARIKNRIIVAEGYMDVVMLSQGGFDESVATMGTAATVMQMEKIIRVAANIVFAFDGDEAGQKAAWRAVEGVLPALKDGVGVSFAFLPPGEDPDSIICKKGAAAFEKLLTAAKPLGDYVTDYLFNKMDSVSEEGKISGALKEGERLINLINNQRAPFLRDLLSEKLSTKANLPADKIRRRMTQQKKPMTRQASYKMRPQSKLFNLLCCLCVRPQLSESSTKMPPLIGDEQEVSIVAGLFSRLQWHPDSGDENIIARLEEEGWTALSRQVQDALLRRFSASKDIEQDFRAIVKSLQDENRRRGGTGKEKWLQKINEKINDDKK